MSVINRRTFLERAGKTTALMARGEPVEAAAGRAGCATVRERPDPTGADWRGDPGADGHAVRAAGSGGEAGGGGGLL